MFSACLVWLSLFPGVARTAQTPAQADAPPSGVVDWLTAHREPGAEVPRSLLDSPESPRVVILGRAACGTHEIARFETATWKLASSLKGFDTLAVDVGFAEGRAADEYVKGGKGDATLIARSFGPWGWSETEVAQLLESMRRANAGTKDGTKSFAGIGVGDPKLLVGPMLDFVRKAYAEGFPRTERIIEPLRGDGRDGRSKYYASDDNDRGMVYAGLDELLSIVRDQAEAMTAKTSAEEYERGLGYVVALVQAEQWLRFDMTGSDVDPRGRVLAENCARLLAKSGPGSRVLVLAHARDLGRATDRDSMPAQLATYFQLASSCVVTAVGAADFPAFDPNDHAAGVKVPRAFALTAAERTPLESALAATGSGPATFDLRAPPDAPAVGQWLLKSRMLRSARPWIAQAVEAPWDYDVGRDFDRIVWFETAHSARDGVAK